MPRYRSLGKKVKLSMMAVSLSPVPFHPPPLDTGLSPSLLGEGLQFGAAHADHPAMGNPERWNRSFLSCYIVT